ncbi:hypothetical protein ACHAXM_004423 [Skeletonema potamos]|jgi:tRNA-dihydrouridine synthase A
MRSEDSQKEFHIAPMLDVSTVEFRYFIRLLTKRSIIWTEMIVAETLVYRNRATNQIGKELASCEVSSMQLSEDLKRYCGWWDKTGCVDPHPTVCQIGTNNPQQAAFAAAVAQRCGFDRIDLNAECPSDRVSGRCFGAVLMQEQDVAATVVRSMVETARIPFSVKTRIGCDESEKLEESIHFIQRLVDAGCTRFVIHARKVYTKGLSPAQNRTVPPLNYPHAYKLMEKFPQCEFVINGGIRSIEHARKVAFGETYDCGDADHVVPCQLCNLPHGSCIAPIKNPPVKGVMVGRLARDHPAALATIDTDFYGEPSNPCENRRSLMNRYIEFLERVYPRRCCDDNDTITLGMVNEMTDAIVHTKEYCDVCGYRGVESSVTGTAESVAALRNPRQSSKRSNRHHRNNAGTKIVSRVIDQSLQPTLGILYGVVGNRTFRRELHRLSRDLSVRNCGPGFILKKAMCCVPCEIWDSLFNTNDDKVVQYFPTK